jgi:hypothetical protein
MLEFVKIQNERVKREKEEKEEKERIEKERIEKEKKEKEEEKKMEKENKKKKEKEEKEKEKEKERERLEIIEKERKENEEKKRKDDEYWEHRYGDSGLSPLSQPLDYSLSPSQTATSTPPMSFSPHFGLAANFSETQYINDVINNHTFDDSNDNNNL